MSGYYGGYVLITVLALLGVVFVSTAFLANRALRPNRPNAAKLSTYECGVDPVGEGWAQTQIRYYVYAFFYVVFAVEAVFLFPWAVVVARDGFGTKALVEMGVFVLFLAGALYYAWRRKVLTWL